MKKLLVIMMALLIAAPAMAGEWDFYGSARFQVGSFDRSKEFVGTGGTWGSSDGINDDTDSFWSVQGNSRIGAKVKTSDAISGRFEYSAAPGLRLLYGVWNFGPGTLLAGQDYTPIDVLYSGQIGNADIGGDDGMLNMGMTYEGRQPQLKLAIQGFELALIVPSTSTTGMNLSGTAYTGIDTTLPKIELAYTFSTPVFSIKPYLGWNSIEVEETGVVNPTSKDIDSSVYGLAFKVNIGPAYINGNLYTATNPTNYGLTSYSRRLVDTTTFASTLTGGAVAIDSAGNVQDADQLSGAIVVGFKVNQMLTFEAGYGIIQDEMDVENYSIETDISAFYIQAAITVVPGFKIVPEYGMIDVGDVDYTTGGVTTPSDSGEITYIAAKLQIDF